MTLYVGQRVVYTDHTGKKYPGEVVSLSDPDHPVVDFDAIGNQIMWPSGLVPEPSDNGAS